MLKHFDSGEILKQLGPINPTEKISSDRISLMQPYFLPYLGYFQLIAASDCFIIYDDAQFIKNGWIERNRYLLDGAPRWFGVPLKKTAHTEIIKERYIANHFEPADILNKIFFAYRKAPFLEITMDWLEQLRPAAGMSIARLNEHILKSCCQRLEINTPILRSSDCAQETHLKAQARVLHIIKSVGGSRYLNPIAGAELYDPVTFADAGYELEFLRPTLPRYRQGTSVFVPSLSIIDAFMFNEIDTVAQWVKQGEIVRD